MRGCLSLTNFMDLVNGSAKGWDKASKVLRQGSPLSPFYFTMTVDVLSRMLLRAKENGLREIFLVGKT